MPCNCDGMEASGQSLESREVAKHLVYAKASMGDVVPLDIRFAAENYYGNAARVHDFTAALCDLIRSMNPEEINRVVYDGRNPKARELATWWDRHQAMDAKRASDEAEKLRKDQLIASARAKLTPEELKALTR